MNARESARRFWGTFIAEPNASEEAAGAPCPQHSCRLILFLLVTSASLVGQPPAHVPPRCGPGFHSVQYGRFPNYSNCIPDCPKGYRPASEREHGGCFPLQETRKCWYTLHPQLTQLDKDWRWSADVCDASALIAKKVSPVYPEIAVSMKLQGMVVFDVFRFKDGRRVIKASSGDPILSGAADAAVKQWQWRPFQVQGRPVEYTARLYFLFELRQGGPRVRTFLSSETALRAESEYLAK